MEGIRYQKQMVAAHNLLARIEQTKAAIFSLTTHTGKWDNNAQVRDAMWETYHKLDELRDILTHATNIAHYG